MGWCWAVSDSLRHLISMSVSSVTFTKPPFSGKVTYLQVLGIRTPLCTKVLPTRLIILIKYFTKRILSKKRKKVVSTGTILLDVRQKQMAQMLPHSLHAWSKRFNILSFAQTSQMALMVKNPPANAGDIRDEGLIPGSGRCPGGGHGNPLQYSYLENPHGQRSLAGYSPQGHKEFGMTEVKEHACLCKGLLILIAGFSSNVFLLQHPCYSHL